jgi:hypothetical protein
MAHTTLAVVRSEVVGDPTMIKLMMMIYYGGGAGETMVVVATSIIGRKI